MRKKTLLLGILFAAAVVRLVALRTPILFDEALSVMAARQPLSQFFGFTLRGCDSQPFLYPLLLKCWGIVSGSDLWLRLLSVAGGVALVWFVYLLGSWLVDENVGLLSAVFVAFSEIYILCSILMRSYSLWFPFTIAAIYFFVVAVASGLRSAALVALICTVVSVYLHHFGVLLILGEIGYWLWFREKLRAELVSWLILFCALLVALLLLRWYLMMQMRSFGVWGRYFISSGPLSKEIYCFLLGFLNIRYELYAYFVFIAGYCFLQRKYLFTRERLKHVFKELPAGAVLVCFLLLPMSAAIVSSLGKYRYLQSRYYAPYFVLFYIYLSWVLLRLPSGWKKLAVALIVTGLFFNAIRFVVERKNSPMEYDLLAAADYIKHNRGPDAIVATDNFFATLHIFNYLQMPITIVSRRDLLKGFYLERIFNFRDEEIVSGYDSLRGKKELWLVLISGGRIPDWLVIDKRLILRHRRFFRGLNVFAFTTAESSQ